MTSSSNPRKSRVMCWRYLKAPFKMGREEMALDPGSFGALSNAQGLRHHDKRCEFSLSECLSIIYADSLIFHCQEVSCYIWAQMRVTWRWIQVWTPCREQHLTTVLVAELDGFLLDIRWMAVIETATELDIIDVWVEQILPENQSMNQWFLGSWQKMR